MNIHSKLLIPALLSAAFVCVCSCKTAGAGDGPSMKVVVKDNEVMGRLVEEQDSCYLVEVQDVYYVEKNGSQLEEWKACDGKGVVFLKEYGERDVHSEADASSPVCGKIIYQEGYVPDTYPCRGWEKGWFKIDLDGIEAFIEEQYAEWDAIDSF